MNTETMLAAAVELVAAAIDGWFAGRPVPAACSPAESRIIVAACWRLYELTPNRERRRYLVELAEDHFIRLVFDDLFGGELVDVPDDTTPGHESCPICNPGEPRCPSTCPHGDQCALVAGHDGGHNHRCDCNEPNTDAVEGTR